jgi:hypothetical protein
MNEAAAARGLCGVKSKRQRGVRLFLPFSSYRINSKSGFILTAFAVLNQGTER